MAAPRPASPVAALLLAGVAFAFALVLPGCSASSEVATKTVIRTVVEAKADRSRRVVRTTDLKAPKVVRMPVVTGRRGQALALVAVRVDGKGPFRFVLDTGASTTTIDAGIARRLGLALEGSAAPVQGVAGVGKGQPVRLSRWRIDTLRMRSRRVVATDLPRGDRDDEIDGLIGSDVLSDFTAVGLDYAAQRLTVGPLRKR